MHISHMETIQFEALRAETRQFETREVWAPPYRNRDWSGERSRIAGVESYTERSPATVARVHRTDTVAAPRPHSLIKVRRRTQLILRRENAQDSPTAALDSASSQGLQVLVRCALHDCDGTTWLLVVDDGKLGRETLEAAGLLYRAELVLLVDITPREGAAAHLTRRLAAAKIDVVYSYAAPAANDRLTAVFKTDDDEYTMRVLQAAPGGADDQGERPNFPSRREPVPVELPEDGEAERPGILQPLRRDWQRLAVAA